MDRIQIERKIDGKKERQIKERKIDRKKDRMKEK